MGGILNFLVLFFIRNWIDPIIGNPVSAMNASIEWLALCTDFFCHWQYDEQQSANKLFLNLVCIVLLIYYKPQKIPEVSSIVFLYIYASSNLVWCQAAGSVVSTYIQLLCSKNALFKLSKYLSYGSLYVLLLGDQSLSLIGYTTPWCQFNSCRTLDEWAFGA